MRVVGRDRKAPAFVWPASATGPERFVPGPSGVRCWASVGAPGGWGSGGYTWGALRWGMKVSRADVPSVMADMPGDTGVGPAHPAAVRVTLEHLGRTLL